MLLLLLLHLTTIDFPLILLAFAPHFPRLNPLHISFLANPPSLQLTPMSNVIRYLLPPLPPFPLHRYHVLYLLHIFHLVISSSVTLLILPPLVHLLVFSPPRHPPLYKHYHLPLLLPPTVPQVRGLVPPPLFLLLFFFPLPLLLLLLKILHRPPPLSRHDSCSHWLPPPPSTHTLPNLLPSHPFLLFS